MRAAQTILELQFGLTGPEQQKRVRLSNPADDVVEVLVKVEIVPLLVLLLPAAVLRARVTRVLPDSGLQRAGGDLPISDRHDGRVPVIDPHAHVVTHDTLPRPALIYLPRCDRP